MSSGPILRLQDLAAETLRGTRMEGPCALVDYPDYSNVGDAAIWLGTLAYFRSRRIPEPRYVASIGAFSEAELHASLPEGPILIQGGGNFGDLWPRHQEFRKHLLERFPDREIIQLPQSIHFGDPANAADTARAIARHGNVRLFVRDVPSYEFAAAHFDCETVLCPDMALFLGPLERSAPEVDVLYLLRTDKERASRDPAGMPDHSFRVADWPVESRVSSRHSRLRRVLHRIGGGPADHPGTRAARYEAAARARVLRGTALLSSGRVVITDRLHAHILCLLLGIPHAVLDNSYGKLGRFLEAWTGETGVAFRADSLDDAERWAAAMVAKADR